MEQAPKYAYSNRYMDQSTPYWIRWIVCALFLHEWQNFDRTLKTLPIATLPQSLLRMQLAGTVITLFFMVFRDGWHTLRAVGMMMGHVITFVGQCTFIWVALHSDTLTGPWISYAMLRENYVAFLTVSGSVLLTTYGMYRVAADEEWTGHLSKKMQ